MKYERKCIVRDYVEDLVKDIDKLYPSFRVVNVFYNDLKYSYIAIIEREVK